eukprot:TRINITY_DN74620_c0_g1_i1.p2 TRINITY_DN74620_c0_g1~~TRINITY_DN74620_c0_g1_i1.p2  ORF type:complete len:296 (-),score=98.57 TRINITY_DN74620_c0_g1_i1:220-1107(-)
MSACVMCHFQAILAVFLLATAAPAVATSKGLAAPLKGGFAGAGSVLQDDFSIVEDDFSEPTATLSFEADFEEGAPTVKEVRTASSEEEPEKPFFFTLIIDLLILAVVTNGVQRYFEERASSKAQSASGTKKKPVETAAALRPVFDELARCIQAGDEAASLLLLAKTPTLRRLEDRCGCSALHLAAHKGCLEVTKKLLELGSNLHATDAWDETPLHFAARAGQVATCQALLEAGAELDAQNAGDWTPALVAAEAKQEAACRFLLEKGATAGGLPDAELPSMFSMLTFERMLIPAAH